jgi:hypothetical protein
MKTTNALGLIRRTYRNRCAARLPAAAGANVLVLEAQNRVGGRTLTAAPSSMMAASG